MRRARMDGVSWHPGCPVSMDRLRLLRVSYWGFDHAAHTGELVMNAAAAAPLARAFGMLFDARYPIRQMRVVDDFGGDDERSMVADNTSAFNCRIVPGTGSSPAMIFHGDAAWRAFRAVGWPWGGDWTSLKDYQHFSANGL